MPNIPAFLEPKVAAQPGPLPRISTYAPIGAFTKPSGPDLSGVLSGLENINEQSQRLKDAAYAKANQVKVLDADNQAAALETHILYDPETGTTFQKGENAFSEPERVSKAWQAGIEQIRGGLVNEDQQLAFDRLAAVRGSRIWETVQRHVGQQHEAYDQQTTAAAIQNRHDTALQNFANSDVVDSQIDQQRAIIKDQAKRTGEDPETTQLKLDRASSGTRFGVLNEYLDRGMDQAASAYLTKYRDQFIGKDLTDAEKLTNKGSLRGSAVRNADTIMQSATTLDDGLAQAAKIDDPDLREETEKRVRQAFADKATSDRQVRDQAYERANKIVQDSKGNLDAVPLSLREQVSPTEWTDLERLAKSIRNPERTTDLREYARLVNLSSLNDSTKQQFVNTDPMTFKGKMSDADYKHIVDLQRTVRNQLAGAATRAETGTKKQEEATTIKASKDQAGSDQAQAIVQGLMKDKTKPVVPPKSRVTVPQWMVDSAQKLPAYKSYLKAHGVDVDGQVAAPVQQQAAPKSPGAPIAPPLVNLSPKPPEDEE